MTAAPQTMLTCTNGECACRVQVIDPCPHGDEYTCACGHAFTAMEGDPIPPTPGA